MTQPTVTPGPRNQGMNPYPPDKRTGQNSHRSLVERMEFLVDALLGIMGCLVTAALFVAALVVIPVLLCVLLLVALRLLQFLSWSI